MRNRTYLTVAFTVLFAMVACTPSASAPPSASGSGAEPSESEVAQGTPEPSEAPPCADESSQEDPIIEGVEEGATITFWTYFLADFEPFILCTIARFEETYPGVTVNWEDHQATYLDDYRNSINAGTQPDVANLSNNEGWVREFAQAGRLLNLSENAPQDVIDLYYPNLFADNTVDGDSYQFPWYQALAVELINMRIFEDAGLTVDDFPETIAELPELCQTIKDETGTLCDIRLSVADYLAQMVYEGGAEVINEDGTAFTFDNAEAVAWLQMYVDMVEAGTVDTDALTTALDRVALLIFSAGQAAFYQTGPQLVRVVKDNNPDLYNNIEMVQAPIGESGVTQPTSMAISVKADTEFPNASMALAAFFTGPRAMLDFAKLVPIYPATPSAFDDPFFSEEPELIEDGARQLARDILEAEQNILPPIPHKVDVNDLVRQAVESALFNDVPAQEALSNAVDQANALLP